MEVTLEAAEAEPLVFSDEDVAKVFFGKLTWERLSPQGLEAKVRKVLVKESGGNEKKIEKRKSRKWRKRGSIQMRQRLAYLALPTW